MNDRSHKIDNAKSDIWIAILIALFGLAVFMLIQGWNNAGQDARPEVYRAPGVRDDFALIVVLIDPSGSMGMTENLQKAKYLLNEKLIPKCGVGDKCLAYFVSKRFTSRQQIFPGWECNANAQDPGVRSQCPDLPPFDKQQAVLDQPAVIKLLKKIPKNEPGIRLGEKEQEFINAMPRLRDKEKETYGNWIGRVSAIPSPQRQEDDYSDICGALKAIGNRFEGSAYKEKWFIAISDLMDDVRLRTSPRPRVNRQTSPCSPELGKGFDEVKTVLIAPFDQIGDLTEFRRIWSLFFPSPIALHALSMDPDDDLHLLAKNPTMGLEGFKREAQWTYFINDATNWLWAVAVGLLAAILGLSWWRGRNASRELHQASDDRGRTS
jgi:hypothetical protein